MNECTVAGRGGSVRVKEFNGGAGVNADADADAQEHKCQIALTGGWGENLDESNLVFASETPAELPEVALRSIRGKC